MRRALTLSSAIMLLIAIIFTLFSGVGIAYAAEPVYSDVLTDLRKDAKFNVDGYPAVTVPKSAEDYKFKVIQIAESEQGELLIYTYQPCAQVKDLRASSINIAREFDNSVGLGFKNYTLTYLHSEGVFYKYKVNDFTLRADAVRYYNISNILRPFDKSVDSAADIDIGGGTVNEIPNEVAQFWTATTVGDNVSYSMIDSDVITVDKKYVGIFEYFDGEDIGWLTGKAHITHTMRNFVAFSTNRDMDRLYEVELEYSLNDISYDLCANPVCLSSAHPYKTIYNVVKGKKRKQDPVILKDKEVTNNPHGWGGHTYKWKQIESKDEFVSKSDSGKYHLTTEGATDINDTQWVISFYDAVWTGDATVSLIDNQLHVKGEQASEVILLRLKFEKEGKVFNLGVVDNKQTGSGKPINEAKQSFWDMLLEQIKNAPWWAWLIVGIIALSIVLTILSAIFPPVWAGVKIVFKAIGKVLFYAVKGLGYVLYYIALGLWYVISAPFKLLIFILHKAAERKESAPAKAKPSKSSKHSKSRRKTPRSKSTGKSRTRSKRK